MDLPSSAAAGNQTRRISAKNECRARAMTCEIGNPKRGGQVAEVTENSGILAGANHLCKAGIPQTPKGVCARTVVWDFLPRIAIEQWNIPYHGSSKIRVVSGLCSSKSTVRHRKV